MTGSIGEGMVDMGANPTGDHRVVAIKRAGANLIDMIEQMEVQLVPGKDGSAIKRNASLLIKQGVALAVEAAVMRTPPPEPPPTSDSDVEGAPV